MTQEEKEIIINDAYATDSGRTLIAAAMVEPMSRGIRRFIKQQYISSQYRFDILDL